MSSVSWQCYFIRQWIKNSKNTVRKLCVKKIEMMKRTHVGSQYRLLYKIALIYIFISISHFIHQSSQHFDNVFFRKE